MDENGSILSDLGEGMPAMTTEVPRPSQNIHRKWHLCGCTPPELCSALRQPRRAHRLPAVLVRLAARKLASTVHPFFAAGLRQLGHRPHRRVAGGGMWGKRQG